MRRLENREEEAMARSTSKAKKTKAVDGNGPERSTASREDILPEGPSESQQFPNWERANPYALSDSTNGSGLESDLHRRIAERAFLLYEERGFRHGDDLDNWLEAERQVKTLGM